MVFYRKYRPQTIDDLDSAAVRETLNSVLKKDVPHAFLFTGPKGLGKTSTARILAKVVNCEQKLKIARPVDNRENGKLKVKAQKEKDNSQLSILNSQLVSVEPCNVCDQCKAITSGTSIDILEIDAASNRGIDEIRDLKEKIRLSPISALKKVYIIDEVHMLTTEAFNALLKTLEEPPEHAMFILCTTEAQKVPSTILSRCFHISFKLATPEELVRSFNRIIISEKAEVDIEALGMIAKLADGGFRDGAKMLEEIITLAGGKKVTKEFIEEKFKVSSIIFQVAAMFDVFKSKDTQKGLQIIADLAAQGVDMKHFIQKLMEGLHEQMITQVATKAKLSDTDLSLEEIKEMFVLLSRAYGEMKYAVLPQLPLELVVLEWTGTPRVIPSEAEKYSTVNHKTKHAAEDPSTRSSVGITNEESGAPLSAVEEDITVTSLRKHVGNIKRQEALYGVPKKEPEDEKDPIVTSTIEIMHTSGDGEVTKEWLDHFWKNLINEMKKHNHTVAGLLRGCTIKSYSKNHLIIEAGYKFHKERLDDMKNRDVLLTICKALTGNEMEIKVELKRSV